MANNYIMKAYNHAIDDKKVGIVSGFQICRFKSN